MASILLGVCLRGPSAARTRGDPTYTRDAVSPDLPPAAGYLPVAYQRGASQAAIFDPSSSETMSRLLADMTAFLDSLDFGARLAEGGAVSAVPHAATRVPPDVQFGCALVTQLTGRGGC